MNQDIFKPIYDFFGIYHLGAYFTLLALSCLLSFPLIFFTAGHFGLSRKKALILPFIVMPAALIMSKVFHILFENHFWDYMHNLQEQGISYFFTKMMNPFTGGHVFYGGLLGGLIAGGIATLISYPKNKTAFLKTTDISSICVVNGLWITRIGCFLEGCCFGRPSQLFGVRFPQDSLTMFMLYSLDPEHSTLVGETQPLIPTQLIHSACNLIIFIVLLKLAFSEKEKPAGFITAVFLLSYSVTRFLIEFLRFDVRGDFLFLSTSQWISLFLFIVGFKLFKSVKKA